MDGIHKVIVALVVCVMVSVAAWWFWPRSGCIIRIPAEELVLYAITEAEAGRDPYIGSDVLHFCPPTLGDGPVVWDPTCEAATWAGLGVVTPGQTQAQYAVIAGGTDDPCTVGEHYCRTVSAGDRWWVSIARSDTDHDGMLSVYVTSYATAGSVVQLDNAVPVPEEWGLQPWSPARRWWSRNVGERWDVVRPMFWARVP